MALDAVDIYQNVSWMNNFDYDRHREEQAVELFAQNIMRAGSIFLDNPMETPFIPSWNRAVSAMPNVLDQFRDAVESDHAQFRPKG